MRSLYCVPLFLAAMFLVPGALLGQSNPLRNKALGEALAGHERDVYHHGYAHSHVYRRPVQTQQPVPAIQATPAATAPSANAPASDVKSISSLKARHASEPAVVNEIDAAQRSYASMKAAWSEAATHYLRGHNVQALDAGAKAWTELSAAATETEKLHKMLSPEEFVAFTQVTMQ